MGRDQKYGAGRLGGRKLFWRRGLGGATWWAELRGRGHADGRGTGRACSLQLLRRPPQHALADPGPRTGTPRRTPAAPGPGLEERGAACRVRARAAGSHRGSQAGAGRGECRHRGGGETPAGTCRSLCLRRAAPVAPPPLPPSQAGDLCRTPCPGKRDPFAQCQTPCIPAGSERGTQALEGGQTRVALAEPGHDTTASLGHPWSHPRGPCT